MESGEIPSSAWSCEIDSNSEQLNFQNHLSVTLVQPIFGSWDGTGWLSLIVGYGGGWKAGCGVSSIFPLPPHAGRKKRECGNNDLSYFPLAFVPSHPNSM